MKNHRNRSIIAVLFSGGQGGTSNAESPKEDEYSNTEMETKDTQKLPFCEIQWQKVTEFVKTRKIKTPDEKPVKEKVRWSYSPDEGPKCTTEPFLTKRKEKKPATSPVQVWNRAKNPEEVLIWFSPPGVSFGRGYLENKKFEAFWSFLETKKKLSRIPRSPLKANDSTHDFSRSWAYSRRLIQKQILYINIFKATLYKFV